MHNSGLRVGVCGNPELPIVEIQNRQLWKSKLQNPIVKTCRPCDGQKGRARALNENDWHLLLLLILLAHVGHYDDQVAIVIIHDRSLWHLCQRAGASHHKEGFTSVTWIVSQSCFLLISSILTFGGRPIIRHLLSLQTLKIRTRVYCHYPWPLVVTLVSKSRCQPSLERVHRHRIVLSILWNM